jgi:hypothetical protein
MGKPSGFSFFKVKKFIALRLHEKLLFSLFSFNLPFKEFCTNQ